MGDFEGKIAVITGAASGIGRAIAHTCAQERMKIVLADIDEKALYNLENELALTGIELLALTIDVSKKEDILRLADLTIETFGRVDLLFNNAGVESGSLLWNTPIEEWEWVLNVNLWGVIHAIRVFIPLMLKQPKKCYIINTASRVGLESGPGMGSYRISKHALVSLSETLYHELKLVNSNIQVSVLCPGYVQTQLYNSHRNAPEQVNQNKSNGLIPIESMIERMNMNAMINGMAPNDIAAAAFEGIRNGDFYILTDSDSKNSVQQRMDDILHDRMPTAYLPK